MTEEVLSFDIDEIMKMIPHRYPFLLIDRITECVPGKYAKGYKNLTFVLEKTPKISDSINVAKIIIRTIKKASLEPINIGKI